MSIRTFLKALAATATHHRPTRRGHPACRPRLEPLVDRWLPSFAAPVDYPVSVGVPATLLTADFNGDGHPDVATSHGETVSVLLGSAEGTLGTAQAFPTGGSTLSIAAGDFNRDGNVDLVVVNDQQQPSILLGTGDGTLQGAYPVPLPLTQAEPVVEVAVADVNADDNPDLLFSGRYWVQFEEGGGLASFSAVTLGLGNGTFSQPFFGGGTGGRSAI